MGKQKGHFSRKHVAETPWGDKNKSLTTTMSEEGWRLVKARAKALKISVSEVLERWARGYDVNFDRSQVLPPTLDTTKDWKPNTKQLLTKTSESLAQATEALEELKVAVAQDQQDNQFLLDFVEALANGELSLADITELSGVVELDDAQINRLTTIVRLFNGGKQPNGV